MPIIPRPPTRRPPRRKNRKKPDYLLLARHLAAAGMIGELLYAAFASPRLAVRNVRVTGAERVPARRVAALSAIHSGGNIFAVNLYRVRSRLIQEPMVRDATVTRILPNTIVIRVQERHPRLIASVEGRFWEVDEQGIPFRTRPEAPPELPLLELPPAEQPAPGRPLPDERWQPTLECLSLAARERLPLRKIAFDAHGELWLNMAVSGGAGGARRLLPVRLGRAEELETKIQQLRWVLPEATADGEYLDLMCANRAAYLKAGDRKKEADAEQPEDRADDASASDGGGDHPAQDAKRKPRDRSENPPAAAAPDAPARATRDGGTDGDPPAGDRKRRAARKADGDDGSRSGDGSAGDGARSADAPPAGDGAADGGHGTRRHRRRGSRPPERDDGDGHRQDRDRD
jgi:hypothetical protein